MRLLAASGAVVGLAVALLLTSSNQSPSPGVFVASPPEHAIPGSLVIHFRDNVPEDQRAFILNQYDAKPVDKDLPVGFVEVQVPTDRQAEIGRLIAATNAVETVSEVTLRYPAAIPDDPSWPAQWNMQAINADVAYEMSTGNDVIVAVLDTGVAFEDTVNGTTPYAKATDLQTPFVFPLDQYGAGEGGDDTDEHPNDDMGHGTHVAGTIAQATNNGLGAAGIAPGVSIMPVKICGPNPKPGQAYGCPTTDIAAGINWTVNHGAQVINLSIGGGDGGVSDVERTALQFASDAGVVVVAAAGNAGSAVLDAPANVPTVISVGAVGISGQLTEYSNHGSNEVGDLMDLVAPGGDPNEGPSSTILQQSYTGGCLVYGQNYTAISVIGCRGTSMAAAHVSGVAALIRSAFPNLNATQVRQTLRCTAVDLGIPGQDAQYGFGLVQADQPLIDVDFDNLPDCVDTDVSTPTPTPEPPNNECLPPTASPSPSPTPSPTPTATPTPSPVVTPSDGPDDETITLSPSPTLTPTPTPTPVGQTPAPTNTPPPTDTPLPTTSPSPTPSPTPFRVKCGDVNCSGLVDGADSLEILIWMSQAGPAAGCLGKGYVNCDDTLDTVDATTILRFVGGLPLGIPASCPGIW